MSACSANNTMKTAHNVVVDHQMCVIITIINKQYLIFIQHSDLRCMKTKVEWTLNNIRDRRNIELYICSDHHKYKASTTEVDLTGEVLFPLHLANIILCIANLTKYGSYFLHHEDLEYSVTGRMMASNYLHILYKCYNRHGMTLLTVTEIVAG